MNRAVGIPEDTEADALRIPDLYAQPEPTISFEFFPPKTDEAEATLFAETVPALKRLRPAFISVTYGAGGSTRDRSLRVVRRLLHDFQIESMAHVTCVGATAEHLTHVLDEAESYGVENILALRGDPPKGQAEFKPTSADFAYALDLIRFVKARNSFAVGAACYPEGHVECKDKLLDWDRAVQKADAGAEFLITQLFYDVNDFYAMEDYLRNKRGVKVPLVPGVLPFLSTEQIKRFTSMCGSKLPDPLRLKLEELAHDDESVRKLGVEVCTEMCRTLLDHGVPGLHLYCLNRWPSSAEILRNLGLS
jgi:methylenetetrahydrofolate reductase (NADPH)